MKVSKRTVFTVELEEQEYNDLKWLLSWVSIYGPENQDQLTEGSLQHRVASQLLNKL